MNTERSKTRVIIKEEKTYSNVAKMVSDYNVITKDNRNIRYLL